MIASCNYSSSNVINTAIEGDTIMSLYYVTLIRKHLSNKPPLRVYSTISLSIEGAPAGHNSGTVEVHLPLETYLLAASVDII